MCGRYYVERQTPADIERLTGRLFKSACADIQEQKDICPSEKAWILRGRDEDLLAEEMTWGFPAEKSSVLMINARAETALDKISFADSVRRRRCIIPAAGFYEWDREKNKASFCYEEDRTIYMAGFYKTFYIDHKTSDRFVIITREADRIVSPVHDRMPLIFEEGQLRDWIFDDEKVEYWLKKQSPILSCKRNYEQLVLPFL